MTKLYKLINYDGTTPTERSSVQEAYLDDILEWLTQRHHHDIEITFRHPGRGYDAAGG